MRSLLGDHLLQRLQQDTEGKLHQRLFRCLRGAIIDGVIQPKTRLPASRDLASEIHVSRNTVLTAYEQLQAEGYLEARTGHGTWVAEKLPESFLNTQNKKKSSFKSESSKLLCALKSWFKLIRLCRGLATPMGCFRTGSTRRNRVSTSYF